MEITKEFIIKNIEQALLCKDKTLEERDHALLETIVKNHFDELVIWSYEDYNNFANLVCEEEDFMRALYQLDLVNPDDLNLPSKVIININVDDFDDEDEFEEFLTEYLSENYNYCVDDFEYKASRSRESVLIFNIEWDFI